MEKFSWPILQSREAMEEFWVQETGKVRPDEVVTDFGNMMADTVAVKNDIEVRQIEEQKNELLKKSDEYSLDCDSSRRWKRNTILQAADSPEHTSKRKFPELLNTEALKN